MAPYVVPERYNVTVKENGTANLECQAYGLPVPTVEWFREPQNVKLGPTDSKTNFHMPDSNGFRIQNPLVFLLRIYFQW